MATDAGELIVKISADIGDIKTQLQSVTSSVGSLGAKTVTTGILMADALMKVGEVTLGFVKESVLAFAEHEQAMTRLSLAIGTDGANALSQYAQQLQRTTAFSDDAILSLENQLIQYGIYPASVKTATAALLDFSARTGKDLPEAGQMLAKAMVGQSRELKNYGIDVSVAATRSENLATVTQGLTEKFGGAAAAMKGTVSGAVESLKNNFSDLQKQIGELLAPTVNGLVKDLDELVSSMNLLVRSHKTYGESIDQQKQKLADLVQMMKTQVTNGVDVTKEEQAQMTALVQHIKVLGQVRQAKDEHVGATNREIAAIRALKDEVLKLQQEEQHLTEITTLETQKRLLTIQDSWEKNASMSDQFRVKFEDDMSKNTSQWVDMVGTMIDSFSSATAKMIVEGGRFKDVLTNLWKQLAEMVIAQILKMIAEWLVWEAVTGGAGGGLGAFGFMAEGGMINEPSMIIGMRSGSRHIAGENGPEQVVPSGQSNVAFGGATAKASGGGGGGSGGGDVHVHITGQFIEGNPSKWQRLVQEQIAPQIRRLAMKDPNSLITRKRGSNS